MIPTNPRVLALLPRFIENRKKDVGTLLAAIEASDFKLIDDLSHRLKGTCGSFGFAAMSEVAGQMQSTRDEATLKKLASELSSQLDSLETRLQG